MAMRKPAARATATGRSRSSMDLGGLKDALKPWVTQTNFVTYTSERGIKNKDVAKLKLYLPHLRRVQLVNRTWNFSLKTIDQVLTAVNEEGGYGKYMSVNVS